jgi:hypothetical protein
MIKGVEVSSTYHPVDAPTQALWLPHVYVVNRRWLRASTGRNKPGRTPLELAGLVIDLEFLEEPLVRTEF